MIWTLRIIGMIILVVLLIPTVIFNGAVKLLVRILFPEMDINANSPRISFSERVEQIRKQRK